MHEPPEEEEEDELDEDDDVDGAGSSVLQLVTSVSPESHCVVFVHEHDELLLFGPSFGQPAEAQHFVPVNAWELHSTCGSLGPGPFQYAEQ